MDELSRQRQERLRRALVESTLDGAVLASPEGVMYATGYRSVGADIMAAHRMAVILTPEDLWVAGPVADAAASLEAGIHPDRFVPFGRFYFETVSGHPAVTMADQHPSFPEALGEAARRAGLEGGRLGVATGLDPQAWAALREVAGSVEDAVEWGYRVRAVKLPGEIELLERAARLAEAGIDAAIGAAHTGSTELELATVVAETMVRGGGEPRFIVVTAGPRSALSDARPTDRRLQAGDLFRFDVGCVVGGYWSDVGRTAVVGEPDDRQVQRYAAILAGEQAQLDAARAGITAADLFSVAVDHTQQAGLRPYRRHHCGHAIGTEVYERPIVAPGWDEELRAGMVLCVETPFYELGWGGMMVEDTLLVTDEGCRVLTVSDRSLRVVG